MKILVVDDEKMIREGISMLVEQSHRSLRVIGQARNGKEALELIDSEKPDLVITDIKMPIMDGLQLIEQLAARYPEIGCVLLTGYADFNYAQQAIRFGVTDYVLKPATPERIHEVVWKVMSRDPARWIERLDPEMLLEMRQVTLRLVKSVLAEDADDMERTLRDWRQCCLKWQLSLAGFKQMAGYIRLGFQAEFLNHDGFSFGDAHAVMNAPTEEELLAAWKDELAAHIRWISGKRVPRNKRVIDMVLAQIERRYGEAELSIHELAADAGVSASYLSKMFREVMAIPLTYFLGDYRLDKAQQLLKNEMDRRLGDIAEACGFTDYPYFSKAFKRKYGISPQEFREKS